MSGDSQVKVWLSYYGIDIDTDFTEEYHRKESSTHLLY